MPSQPPPPPETPDSLQPGIPDSQAETLQEFTEEVQHLCLKYSKLGLDNYKMIRGILVLCVGQITHAMKAKNKTDLETVTLWENLVNEAWNLRDRIKAIPLS